MIIMVPPNHIQPVHIERVCKPIFPPSTTAGDVTGTGTTVVGAGSVHLARMR
jgi:hypothetical protein